MGYKNKKNFTKFMILKKILLFKIYIQNSLYWKHLFYKIIYKFYYNKHKSNHEIINIIKSKNKIFNTAEFIKQILDYEFIKFEIPKDINIKNNSNNFKIGGSANLDLLYSIIINSQYKNILETGVAAGWSSLSILKAIKNIENANLTSIDLPYPGIKNKDYIGSVVPKYLRDKWQIYIASDRTSLDHILSKKMFDLVHYDSDKSYYGRLWAYKKIWKNLSKGGIFISDDISDNMAFLDFVNNFKLDYFIIYYKNKYIGIIKKND